MVIGDSLIRSPMKTQTFWIVHPASKSRAMAEFGLVDKKVKLMGIFWTHGNVVDIRLVRECQQEAKQLFLNSWQTPPFIG
jgi:hypothetical protein